MNSTLKKIVFSFASAAMLAGCSKVDCKADKTDGGSREADCAKVEQADICDDDDSAADSGAETDTSLDLDTDNAEGTGTDLDCPGPIAEACPETVTPLPVLLTAFDIGEGALFTALGKDSLLAVRESDTGSAVLLFAALKTEWGESRWTLKEGGLAELPVPDGASVEAVGSVSGAPVESFGFAQLALICLDSDCALYGANVEAGATSAIVPLDNGDVPCGPSINGLKQLGVDNYLVCAYGAGFCCFDGSSWSVIVEYDPEKPLLNDVAHSFKDVIAVGDTGRLLSNGFPDWEDSYGGTAYPDYLSVTMNETQFLVSGAGGFLTYPWGVSQPCKVADEDIVALNIFHDGWDPTETIAGVTASGKIFYGYSGNGSLLELSQLCYTGQEVGPPVGTMVETCGITDNLLVLTDTVLYGTEGCAVD